MTLLAPSQAKPAADPISPAEFAGLAELLHGGFATGPAGDEAAALAGKAERLRALGLRSFRDYCRILAAAGDASREHLRLAELCSETPRFLAEPCHIAHLLQSVLPDVIARIRRGGSLRIWSAGCGGGHEPYTIAMAVLSAMPDAGRHDVRILASDIDPLQLNEARAGFYRGEALADVPKAWAERWLIRMTGGGDPVWQVAEDARDLVALRELNLLAEWPMRRSFDLVVCRNVLVPFEPERQVAVWRRLAGVLKPRGVLFTGVTEDGPSEAGFAPVGDGIWRLERRR